MWSTVRSSMRCKRCGVEVSAENQDPWLGKSWCRKCGMKYRSDYNTTWAKSHRPIMNQRARRRYLKAKLEAVQALGGRCACTLPDCWHRGPCPIVDHRIIQFDHVRGGGKQEVLKSISGGVERLRYYRRITKSANAGERKYQLLCANCNWMKRMVLGL
jgi:hypothetical protein